MLCSQSYCNTASILFVFTNAEYNSLILQFFKICLNETCLVFVLDKGVLAIKNSIHICWGRLLIHASTDNICLELSGLCWNSASPRPDIFSQPENKGLAFSWRSQTYESQKVKGPGFTKDGLTTVSVLNTVCHIWIGITHHSTSFLRGAVKASEGSVIGLHVDDFRILVNGC